MMSIDVSNVSTLSINIAVDLDDINSHFENCRNIVIGYLESGYRVCRHFRSVIKKEVVLHKYVNNVIKKRVHVIEFDENPNSLGNIDEIMIKIQNCYTRQMKNISEF